MFISETNIWAHTLLHLRRSGMLYIETVYITYMLYYVLWKLVVFNFWNNYLFLLKLIPHDYMWFNRFTLIMFLIFSSRILINLKIWKLEIFHHENIDYDLFFRSLICYFQFLKILTCVFEYFDNKTIDLGSNLSWFIDTNNHNTNNRIMTPSHCLHHQYSIK